MWNISIGKSAVTEIVRILRREDNTQDLHIYWHYFSGDASELLLVLELYKSQVNILHSWIVLVLRAMANNSSISL